MMTHFAPLGRVGTVLCGLRIAVCGAFRPGGDDGVCRACARYILRYVVTSAGSTTDVVRFWPVRVVA